MVQQLFASSLRNDLSPTPIGSHWNPPPTFQILFQTELRLVNAEFFLPIFQRIKRKGYLESRVGNSFRAAFFLGYINCLQSLAYFVRHCQESSNPRESSWRHMYRGRRSNVRLGQDNPFLFRIIWSGVLFPRWDWLPPKTKKSSLLHRKLKETK